MTTPAETLWTGRYIQLRREGSWEYVSRVNSTDAAIIVAIDDGHILLIDQYRIPLKRRCLELPAGLVGDDIVGESVEAAAARELEEETGHRAERIEIIGRFASSPGMVSETFTLVRATGLTKVGAGGGNDDEEIVVHRVKLNEVGAFVAAKRAEGMVIDVRLLLALGVEILGG